MDISIINVTIGIIVVVGFGVFSYVSKVVDIGGFIAGIFVGLTIWIFGGWNWFVIILIFHLFAAMMTKYKYKRKEQSGLAQEKGGARGYPNVLANGLIASFFSLFFGIYYITLKIYYDLLFFGFLGAISAMCADTVATELGLLSKKSPRLITNFKKVVPGTSGGVTLLGEFASFLGASIMGLAAWIFTYLGLIDCSFSFKFPVFIIALGGGILGCLVDSIIGATIQGIYKCPKCNKLTEKKIHNCGTRTDKIRGIAMIDNNVVNLIASSAGSIFSILIYILFKSVFFYI
ncbi:MAG: DUF92 domain-containing protein [Candidatus Helarchaeota archaeon]